MSFSSEHGSSGVPWEGMARALQSESSLLSLQASNWTALCFGVSVKRDTHAPSINSFHYIPDVVAGANPERVPPSRSLQDGEEERGGGTTALGLEPSWYAVVIATDSSQLLHFI